MRTTSLLTALLAVPLTGLAANAAPSGAVAVVVRETAGIRRGNFPARAVVPLAAGVLKDASQVRLMLDELELSLQSDAAASWPDGSVRELELHFNVTIGPLDEKRYRLEIGVQPKPVVVERLKVHESDGGLQVGKVRFGSEAGALIQSVTFGEREFVGAGANGFLVTAQDGAAYLLEPDGVAVRRAGPLAARIIYTGAVQLGPQPVPFAITLEVPNSKSWVKYSVTIEDPGHRIRDLAFTTSLAFGAFPWSWDFGTGSRTYGALRATGDSVALVQSVVKPGATDWQIRTRTANAEGIQERAAGLRPTLAEGWGHLEGADRALAFAVEDFGRRPGDYSIALSGDGQLVFRFAPSGPEDSHTLAIYQHYVSTPVSVGAATSPIAMATPLVVTVDP